jgi:hypothetical protein
MKACGAGSTLLWLAGDVGAERWPDWYSNKPRFVDPKLEY